jgi:hypothetical protein
VNQNLPNGCLAGGIPARILRENIYPRRLTQQEKRQLIRDIADDIQLKLKLEDNRICVTDAETGRATEFDLERRTIKGASSSISIFIMAMVHPILLAALNR